MAGINPALAVPGLGKPEDIDENKEDDLDVNGDAEAKLNEQKGIITDLCAKAPSSTVRDCLRKYDPSKQQWQIINGFKADVKKVLVDTLEYLGKPNMNKYKAEALPNELYCRIQNLLPDICHLCKVKYCLSVSDTPVLSCAKCGQGCHNECILKLIDKTEDDLAALNPEDREALVNPHSHIGLFYVCGPCQPSTIPQRTELLKKVRFGRDNGNNTNDAPPNNDNPPTAVHSDGDVSAASNTTPADPAEPPATAKLPLTVNGDTTAVSDGDASAVSDRTLTNNQAEPQASADNQALAINERPHAPPAPVCKHYKNARCKYGISGKKDGEGVCPYSHPKVCKKLIEHGNRGPRGCTKGDNCELFHPKMCHRSLRDRTCINPSCKVMHVKGTKRSEVTIQVGESTNINYREERQHSHAAVSTHPHRMHNNSYAAPQYAAPQYTTPQYTGPQYAAKPNPRDNQTQDYFLDALLQMKAEILKELDRKLQQTYPTRVNHQIIPQMYNTLPVHQTIPNHPILQQNMQNQFPPLQSQNQGQMVTH